jgi:hypothetical protein
VDLDTFRFTERESRRPPKRDEKIPSEASYRHFLETPFHGALQKVEGKFKGGALGFLHRIC